MGMRIAKLRALDADQQALLLVAFILMPVFGLGLRVFGLARVQAWIERSVQSRRSGAAQAAPAAIGALVNVAGRYAPVPSNCLTRSLLLDWLLRRRGVPCELRIGVRLHCGELQAHAWVEHQGKPVNDAADIALRFAPFAEPLSHKLFPKL